MTLAVNGSAYAKLCATEYKCSCMHVVISLSTIVLNSRDY